jgi:hypothetical protein
MASAELSRRVEKVVGYPPLSKLDAAQRREFHEALLDADSLPGSAPVATPIAYLSTGAAVPGRQRAHTPRTGAKGQQSQRRPCSRVQQESAGASVHRLRPIGVGPHHAERRPQPVSFLVFPSICFAP